MSTPTPLPSALSTAVVAAAADGERADDELNELMPMLNLYCDPNEAGRDQLSHGCISDSTCSNDRVSLLFEVMYSDVKFCSLIYHYPQHQFVNITRQMALTAAALLPFKQVVVCNLFPRRIGAIFGMLSRRAGLSASAGLSCLKVHSTSAANIARGRRLCHFVDGG